jgi:hypothetical protein
MFKNRIGSKNRYLAHLFLLGLTLLVVSCGKINQDTATADFTPPLLEQTSAETSLRTGVSFKIGSAAIVPTLPTLNIEIFTNDIQEVSVVESTLDKTTMVTPLVKYQGEKPYYLYLYRIEVLANGSQSAPTYVKQLVYNDYYPGGSKYTDLSKAWDAYWYGIDAIEEETPAAGTYIYVVYTWTYNWTAGSWAFHTAKSEPVVIEPLMQHLAFDFTHIESTGQSGWTPEYYLNGLQADNGISRLPFNLNDYYPGTHILDGYDGRKGVLTLQENLATGNEVAFSRINQSGFGDTYEGAFYADTKTAEIEFKVLGDSALYVTFILDGTEYLFFMMGDVFRVFKTVLSPYSYDLVYEQALSTGSEWQKVSYTFDDSIDVKEISLTILNQGAYLDSITLEK